MFKIKLKIFHHHPRIPALCVVTRNFSHNKLCETNFSSSNREKKKHDKLQSIGLFANIWAVRIMTNQFPCRAAQRIVSAANGTKTGRTRGNGSERGGFCGALQRAPPPMPAQLLRRLTNKENLGFGKVRSVAVKKCVKWSQINGKISGNKNQWKGKELKIEIQCHS